MAKVKAKKGDKLVCVPCGREVVVDNCGISRTTLWCCGKPMKKKNATPLKKMKSKPKNK